MDIENQRKSLRCAVLQLVYLRLMILQGSNIEIGGHGGLKAVSAAGVGILHLLFICYSFAIHLLIPFAIRLA